MPTSVAPRMRFNSSTVCRARPNSTSESGPLNSTARFADVPLVSSVTLSMIGCVKLKRVVGNFSR